MKSKEVLKLLKVTRPTLCRYVKTGIIRAEMQVNGAYNYNAEDVYKLMYKENPRKSVIYCRTTNKDQINELEKQIDTLKQFCSFNGILIDEEFKDIGSGMTLNRKGFQALIDEVTDFKIKAIYVTHKDRISRNSYDMIEKLFLKYGCEIISLNATNDDRIISKELYNEIVDILNCFNSKTTINNLKESMERMNVLLSQL